MSESNDDEEVLYALGMALEHDERHQALALRTWFPRIKIWLNETTRLKDDAENLRALIRQFDAAIRRIATELTGQACCGVDIGDEINPDTEEPYGPGGHTGWLLATEAKKLREELTLSKGQTEYALDAMVAMKERAEQAERQLAGVVEALEFYADPETYFGIAFAADRPAGGFDEDFEELSGELGHPDGGTWVKPGKRARQALANLPKALKEQSP